MEIYKKPAITCISKDGIIPAALAGAVAAIKGLSAAALLVGGAAYGLAKGKIDIDSTHTSTLTARKNFSLG